MSNNLLMGKIILVSATPLEHDGLKDINGVPIFQVGIGKTNSAMNLTEVIIKQKPDLVVNFGSCGNLKNHKVGEVIKVGKVYNNIDVRPFAEYGCTPESAVCEIKLSDSEIKCFSTDQIYDNTRTDYAEKYLEMIRECNIVDMECYPYNMFVNIITYHLNHTNGFDDGNVDKGREATGFQNFREHFLQTFENTNDNYSYQIQREHLFSEQHSVVDQSVDVNEILVCDNRKDNKGVWERFKLTKKSKNDFVWILDDDTIPGKDYLKNVLDCFENNQGLYGTCGYIFNSNKKYENNYTRIGLPNPNEELRKVDYVVHNYFSKRNGQHFWNVEKIPFNYGEDMIFLFNYKT